MQFFNGQEYFEHRLPCDPSQIGRFRQVFGEAGVAQLRKTTGRWFQRASFDCCRMTAASDFATALVGLRPPDTAAKSLKPRVQRNPAGSHLICTERYPNNRRQRCEAKKERARFRFGGARTIEERPPQSMATAPTSGMKPAGARRQSRRANADEFTRDFCQPAWMGILPVPSVIEKFVITL